MILLDDKFRLETTHKLFCSIATTCAWSSLNFIKLKNEDFRSKKYFSLLHFFRPRNSTIFRRLKVRKIFYISKEILADAHKKRERKENFSSRSHDQIFEMQRVRFVFKQKQDKIRMCLCALHTRVAPYESKSGIFSLCVCLKSSMIEYFQQNMCLKSHLCEMRSLFVELQVKDFFGALLRRRTRLIDD